MSNKTYNLRTPLVVVTSLFFMWGFITVLVDSLVPRLREVFELSYFQAGLVQFAFFIAYGLISIPAGGLLARIGYKKGMLVGLVTMGLGCLLFWPAAGLRFFPLFLLGYFVLASGMTVLQVAANPYVAELGPERGASSRLNMAQAFNSLGTTLAPLVGAAFLLSDRIRTSADIAALSTLERAEYHVNEAAAVQGPFVALALALLLLALAVSVVELPRLLPLKDGGGYREALRHGRLRWGALAIFLYVGAEVAIGSYAVNYFMSMDLADLVREHATLSGVAHTLLGSDPNDIDAKGVLGAFVAFYWGGAMVGRFAGSLLTAYFPPARVLAFFGAAAMILVAVTMATTGLLSMGALLAVGLFNSILFPTIFAISVEGLGDLKPQGSGVLCTAIVGGAIVPPLLGLLADGFGFKTAFVLVLLCYGYIVAFSMNMKTGGA